MKKILSLLALICLSCMGAWAQTVPEISTDANPKYYLIASYDRGGVLTANGEGVAVTHEAFASSKGLWYFTAADGNSTNEVAGGVIAHNVDGFQLTTDWKTASEGGVIYILPNGQNNYGLSISKTATIGNGSCIDANNNSTGVGNWNPRSGDWQGTTWVFQSVDDYYLNQYSLASSSLKSSIQTRLAAETTIPAKETLLSTFDTEYAEELNGKLFFIKSGYPNFQTNQHVDKAFIASNTTVTWGTFDENDPMQYFKVTYTNERKYNIAAAFDSENKYINGSTGTLNATPATISIKVFDNGTCNIICGNSNPIHANSHSNGNGLTGNLIAYAGVAGSPSSWIFVETSAVAYENAVAGTATTLQNKINTVFTNIVNKKVGYPSYGDGAPQVNNDAVNALSDYQINELVSAANYTDALTKYNAVVALTNINLPVSGKAYKLNFLHNNTASTKRYIKYDANGLGLTIEAGEAATILFTEVDATNHKYIMTLADGNLLTWQGDGNEGFKVDGATAKGYSTMVANQANNDDWNLCWFANQGTDEAQLGTIKMSSPRHASSAANSCWVISNAGAWAKANEISFFASNGATSALQFEEVAGVTSETAGYADGVEKYTLYVKAKEYDPYVGEGLGKYSYNTNQTSGLLAAVKDCTTLNAERTIVNSIALNMPEAGKFYAFKAVQRNKYLANTADANGLLETENKNDAIFYLTAGESAGQVKLLSYKNGQYASGTGLAAVGSSNYYTIEQAKNGSSANMLGQYAIVADNGNRLNMWENGYVRQNGTNYNNWEGWTIEEVEELPVNMVNADGAYYASLYLPVAVTLPEGVKAYSAEVDGDQITLTKVVEADVLKANTPVILYAESEISAPLAISEETGTGAINNTLSGTIAAVSAADGSLNYGAYVLNHKNHENIGFYKTTTKINGFKAYLGAGAVSTLSNSLSLRFEDVTTAISAIEGNSKNVEIFDLQGRRLTKAQQGMNIINGHKVLVK